MRSVLFATAILGLTVSEAAAAKVDFVGAMCFTATNAACVADGTVAGTCMLARFRPPGLGDNGTPTKISFIGQGSADNFTLQNGTLIGNAFKAVNGTGIGGSGYSYQAQMRFTKQVPAVLTAATTYATIEGNIANYQDVPGCNLAFRATFTQRP